MPRMARAVCSRAAGVCSWPAARRRMVSAMTSWRSGGICCNVEVRLRSSNDGTRLTGTDGGVEEEDDIEVASLRGVGAAGSVLLSVEAIGVWFWFVIRMADLLSLLPSYFFLDSLIESIREKLPTFLPQEFYFERR